MLGRRAHTGEAEYLPIVPQMALLPRSRIVYKISQEFWNMIADYLAVLLVGYAAIAFKFLNMRYHFSKLNMNVYSK